MDNQSKLIYSQICAGFTPVKIGGAKFYIKHPDYGEFFSLYSNHDRYLDRAAKNELRTYDQALKFIINQGWWSEEIEQKIVTIQNYVRTQHKTIKALNSNNRSNELEAARINEEIKTWTAILESYLLDRRKLIGTTAEEWALDKINKDAILEFFYVDAALTQKVSEDDIDFNLLNIEYQNFLLRFDTDNIKLVSASPFFRSLLFIFNEDISNFFGIPTAKLTRFQNDLLTYGKVYQNKIKAFYSDPNNKQGLPDDILENPEKLIHWAESNHKTVVPKSAGNGTVIQGYFGTPEQAKNEGVVLAKTENKDSL